MSTTYSEEYINYFIRRISESALDGTFRSKLMNVINDWKPNLTVDEIILLWAKHFKIESPDCFAKAQVESEKIKAGRKRQREDDESAVEENCDEEMTVSDNGGNSDPYKSIRKFLRDASENRPVGAVKLPKTPPTHDTSLSELTAIAKEQLKDVAFRARHYTKAVFELGKTLYLIKEAIDDNAKFKEHAENEFARSMKTIKNYIDFYTFVREHPRFLSTGLTYNEINNKRTALLKFWKGTKGMELKMYETEEYWAEPGEDDDDRATRKH